MTDTAAGGARPPEGLSGRIAAGAFWSVAQKLATRITGFVTLLILARLLSPADFGVVTVASTLIPFLQLLADIGITVYMLQHANPTKLLYDTYFWASSTIAAVGCVALVLAAPLIVQAFGEPEAAPVLQGLAPMALFVTLGAVPQTMLRREMRYRAIAVQAAIAGLASQAVAIAAAFAGWGAWALVLQNDVVNLIATILAWVAAGYRPSFEFSWSELRLMVRFGSNLVASGLISTAAQWLVNLIIVSTLGVTALGYLNIMQRLLSVILDVTLSAVIQVSTVAFAMIRDSIERLRAGYLRSLSMMYALFIPAMVFVAASAGQLVPLMYGDQWTAAIIPGAILAAAKIFGEDVLDNTLYMGIGRPSLWLVYTIVSNALIAAVTWLAAPLGLDWMVVLSALATGVVLTFARWVVSARQIEARWWQLGLRLVRVGVPALIAGAAGYGVSLLIASLPPIVGVICVGLAIVVVYLPLLRFMERPTWDEVVRLATPFIRRFTRRSAGLAA